jgi:hypothetical protein
MTSTWSQVGTGGDHLGDLLGEAAEVGRQQEGAHTIGRMRRA